MFKFKDEYIKSFKDKTRIYFIENYLSTQNAMDGREVPFKLFPRQKVYIKSCAENNNTIAIKYRQSGITTISSAYITAQCVFARKESPETVLCIANKLDQALEIIEKIFTFLGQVPRWFWGPEYYSPNPDDERNKKSIFVKKNKGFMQLVNGCKIYARASSPHAARGISAVTILIVDEAAYIENSTSVFTAAIAAQNTVSNPKCFIVSTPNGKDPLYYNTYIQAVKGQNNFNAVEFRWFQDPRFNKNLKWHKKNDKTGEILWDVDPTIDDEGNIVYDEERWKKLTREGWEATSPWFERTCKSFNNDQQKISQEILVSFLGSADNVVPIDVIEFHSKTNVVKITEDWNLKDPLIRETWIWKDPCPNHRYICSVDPSSGSGDDFTSIQIIDVDAVDDKGYEYFEQVLEYTGKLNGESIAELIFKYATSYNNALVVVEAIGGYGDSVILSLLNMKYPNLYYDETDYLKNYTNDFSKKLFNKKDNERLPGFRSSGLRIRLISNFVEMLKNNSFKVRSERVISELDTWVFKNGRPDHMDGAHDDNIMCLAMGLFVMLFYMLKTDRNKNKDCNIIQSWCINNYSSSTNNNIDLNKDINISQKKEKFNPFKSYEEHSNNILNACIMLGGFKIKK